jgi:hypothetical protein
MGALLENAHDVEIVVRLQIIFLFVEVNVAARHDDEIILPVVGESVFSDSKC